MTIKHLQLNTSTLKSPDEVCKFITDESIDIACLQEIVYPIDGTNPLQELIEQTNYHYLEGVNFFYKPNNQVIAEAIVSKYPIKSWTTNFYNAPEFEPKTINASDILGELVTENSAMNFPGSRGIKHAVKSRCIVTAVIETPEGLVRAMTAHYSVSDLCTETIQMLEMSQMIKSLVKYSNPLPTVFSGDLNIRVGSYSVAILEQVMECHTKEMTDTLSSDHEAKKKDFPNGLAIDHVFSNNFKHLSTNAREVSFSNHKAIVSEFEI